MINLNVKNQELKRSLVYVCLYVNFIQICIYIEQFSDFLNASLCLESLT